MISGRPRFPLEDFDVKPHDLRNIFPDNSDVPFVHRRVRIESWQKVSDLSFPAKMREVIGPYKATIIISEVRVDDGVVAGDLVER